MMKFGQNVYVTWPRSGCTVAAIYRHGSITDHPTIEIDGEWCLLPVGWISTAGEPAPVAPATDDRAEQLASMLDVCRDELRRAAEIMADRGADPAIAAWCRDVVKDATELLDKYREDGA